MRELIPISINEMVRHPSLNAIFYWDNHSYAEMEPVFVNLLFKKSCSDNYRCYRVPYDVKLWKTIQLCASEISISFKDDIYDNSFRVLINDSYPYFREALNSTPKELHLCDGDIITVDDEDSFNEWARQKSRPLINYIPHKQDSEVLHMSASDSDSIYLMIVVSDKFQNEPHDVRCPIRVYPENTLQDIYNLIRDKYEFNYSYHRCYFSHNDDLFHDELTNMAEIGIKDGDVLFMYHRPYTNHHFEFIRQEDAID